MAIIVNIMNNWIIFLIIIIVYFLILLYLNKRNILKKYNISFYGPALMIRTFRGIKWLTKISNRKRFWKAFGSFGILFCFIMMIFMILLLIFQTWTVIGFSPEQIEELPGIEFGLVIGCKNALFKMSQDGIFCDMFGRKHRVFFK